MLTELRLAKTASLGWIVPLLLLGILIVVVYFPGRAGPFLADDYPNIIDNNGVVLEHLSIEDLASAWNANTSGPFKRPIASLSFALNYYFADQHFDPVAFKLTNVAIHIINSFLLFFLGRLLLSVACPSHPAQKLAFIATLIWALNPLQLTSVLYVVQRMSSLSCTFILAGFLIFLKGRLRSDKYGGSALMFIGCFLGTTLGALVKENALLLPLLIFVSEVTLLPSISDRVCRNKIYTYYLVTVIVPVALGIGYLIVYPEYVLNGYLTRGFSFSERLMTEARIIFYYLGLFFYPDNTQLSLAHDDYGVSKGLLQPISTFFAIVGVVALLTVSVFNSLRKKTPFLSFAILWFFVGHSMESTIFPLELIYEHRNYVPSIGVAIAFTVLVYELLIRVISNGLLNTLYACIILSLGMATHTRAAIWSNLDSFSYFEVRNHPNSVRANSAYANTLELKKGPNAETYQHYLIASQLNIFEVSTLVEMFKELNSLLYFHDPSKDKKYLVLPAKYDDPLVLDSQYMHVLKKLVNQEILRRISGKSHPLRTSDAIRTSAVCVINGDYECKEIASNVVEWLDAALALPGFYDIPVMHLIKAKLFFNQNQVGIAMAEINKAIELTPDRMYFYAEKAYLLITLGEYDQAEKLIQQAESRGVANSFDAEEFKKLRDAILIKNSALHTQAP
jgi:tetratricopeptide (TPR) repeat protein